MSHLPYLLGYLGSLLDYWNRLAQEAAQKVNTTAQTAQAAYYTGVMFGMETARDELAAMLAIAMAEVAKS